MAVSRTPYPYSASEARRAGELDQWRESHRENIRCKEAIEAAIREGFDGMYLNGECAKGVIEEFGYERVRLVLSYTLRQLSHDGRFSPQNIQWGRSGRLPLEQEHVTPLVVRSHPAVLNGFIDQYRQEWASLNLFDSSHCEPDATSLDYTGRVLALRTNVLKEEFWKPEYQLWYAHDGFGCGPKAIGRSIRCTCLGDGEQTRWNRAEFFGPVREECLPDWVPEKLAQYVHAQTPQMGGMEMK